MKNNTVNLIPTRKYHAAPRLTHEFKRKLKSEVRLCFVNRDFIELIEATLKKLPIKDKLPCLYYFQKLAKQELRQADPEWVYVNQEQYDDYMWAIRDEQKHYEPVTWINAEIEEMLALANLSTMDIDTIDGNVSEPMPAFDPELVPEADLLKMLRISKSKIQRLRAEGMPNQQIGKPYYYNLKLVKEWLKRPAA